MAELFRARPGFSDKTLRAILKRLACLFLLIVVSIWMPGGVHAESYSTPGRTVEGNHADQQNREGVLITGLNSDSLALDDYIGEVHLYWIAPGDDCYEGLAAGYDLRYRPEAAGRIDSESRWQSAIQVEGESAPSPPGQLDSMVVTGLEIGLRYYFCIRTYDEAGNIAELSNSPLLAAQAPCFTIDIDTVGCGAVVISPLRACYDYGDTVTISAFARESYYFSGWTGDVQGVINPLSFVVTDNMRITAIFDSEFLPGDANSNGRVQVSDITFLITYFKGIGPGPNPYLAGDANGNCFVCGSDVTYLLTYFEGNGPPPFRGDCSPQE